MRDSYLSSRLKCIFLLFSGKVYLCVTPKSGICRRILSVRGHSSSVFFSPWGSRSRRCFGVELFRCCLQAMASKCGRGWCGCGAALRGVRSTSRYIRARSSTTPEPFASKVVLERVKDSKKSLWSLNVSILLRFYVFLNECRERVCDTALSHGRVAAFSKPSVVPRQRTWPEPCNGIVEHVTRRSFHSTS